MRVCVCVSLCQSVLICAEMSEGETKGSLGENK